VTESALLYEEGYVLEKDPLGCRKKEVSQQESSERRCLPKKRNPEGEPFVSKQRRDEKGKKGSLKRSFRGNKGGGPTIKKREKVVGSPLEEKVLRKKTGTRV